MFRAYPVDSIPSLPLWLELLTVMTVSAYGAAVARDRNVPVVGTLLAGIIVGVGGGIFRDLLLGMPPMAMSQSFFIPVSFVAAIFGAIFFFRLVTQKIPNLVIDGIALGLLISIGAQKALANGFPFFSVILCGIFTACIGGTTIDVLTRHRPAIISQAHWYASALTAGALCYWVVSIYINPYLGIMAAVCVTVSLRVLSVVKNWSAPKWPGESENMDV